MSAFAISFGYAWRLVVALNLSLLVLTAIAITPNHVGAIGSALISALVMPTFAVMTMRLLKRDPKERFAIASIIGNGSMALFMLTYAMTDPAGPNTMTYILLGMSAFFSFSAYRRQRDFQTGRYAQRFEGKAKLPSPFAVLKR